MDSSRCRGGFQTRPTRRQTNPGASHRRSFECCTIRNSRCTGSRHRYRQLSIQAVRKRHGNELHQHTEIRRSDSASPVQLPYQARRPPLWHFASSVCI
jgi:hypothetical protein